MDNLSDFHESVEVHSAYHGVETYQRVCKAWNENGCLILCPPHLKPNSFVREHKIPKKIVLGVFTSGTLTGKPRLVLYTKKNIESSLNSIRKLFDLKRIDKIFCYPQPTHTFGLILGYVQACIYNLPLAFHEGAYSAAAHDKWLAEKTAGMLTLATPTHVIDLICWVKNKGLKPSPSYSAVLGGAPVTKNLWHDLQDILNIEQPSIGYGATEASPGIMHLAPGAVPSVDGAVGKILDGVQMNELGPKGFVFSGDNVCAAIIDETGYHAPPNILIKDTLTLGNDDNYVFNGRSDLILNRGGIKISPELIESTLLAELNLKSVCVSLFSERLGEDLGLLIATENEADKLQVQKILQDKMALKIANENIVLGATPMNANAKVDRIRALKLVMRSQGLKLPLAIEHLRPFLPHRPPAIWVSRLTHFEFRKGNAEADLDYASAIFTDGELRESACIELIAQAYGYALVSYELMESQDLKNADKTLIAEVKRANFFFKENRQLIHQAVTAKLPLIIETNCSHDFGAIKVIHGTVKIKETVLASLSLKAFVSVV